MKKIINTILWLIVIFVLVWVIASYVDVTFHNLDKMPTYAGWNLFEIIF